MLAQKDPPPSSRHPDHRVGRAGHPKVPAWQVPGEVPGLLQGIQPAGAVALGGCKVRVAGAPAPAGPAPGRAAGLGDSGRPEIVGVPPARQPITDDAPDAIPAPGPTTSSGDPGAGSLTRARPPAAAARARGAPLAAPLLRWGGSRTLPALLRYASPAPWERCWELVGGCLLGAPPLPCCVEHRPPTAGEGQGGYSAANSVSPAPLLPRLARAGVRRARRLGRTACSQSA